MQEKNITTTVATDKQKPSDLLDLEIKKGREGKNEGIPFGGDDSNRMNNYIQIRNSTNILVGGFAGSGKTSFVDELFVLEPMDYLIKNNLAYKYVINYWSMERPKVHKLAKWLSRIIFKKEGYLLDFKKILGWTRRRDPLTDKDLAVIGEYMPALDEIFNNINFLSGRQNPTGIRKYIQNQMEGPLIKAGNKDEPEIRDHTKGAGYVTRIDKYNKTFTLHDPSIIYMNIYDHVGKLKSELGKTRKELLDDFSDDQSNDFRDLYGMSNIDISQFNRAISNPLRIKNGDVEPQAEDFKETGDLFEDVDICLTLFDPFRYKVADPSGYNLEKLKDKKGKKYYRNVKLIKNNYGGEDVRFPFAYQPETGLFSLLPANPKELTDQDYEDIKNNIYFLR